MRSFVAALLLLLMLPGLLLPAGMLLHICGCATKALPEHNCCQHDAKAPDAEPAPHSCCGQPAQPGDDADADGKITAAGCACQWIALGDELPEPTPPPAPPQPELLPPPAPFVLPTVGKAPPASNQRWCVTATRPPPPDHHRSLPLRL